MTQEPLPAMSTPIRIARAALAVLVLAAVGWQLRLHVGASYSVLNFFSYFTNLSNLFAAAVLLATSFPLSSTGRDAQDTARYLSAVNMAVVGIVFVVLLRNVDLGALLPWINVLLHYVMPGAVVLDWLLLAPRRRLTARHLALSLAFPAVYLGYVLLRGSSAGWYPYPFLDPVNVGGYGGVAAYGLGIFVTFVMTSSILLAAGNRRAGPAA